VLGGRRSGARAFRRPRDVRSAEVRLSQPDTSTFRKNYTSARAEEAALTLPTRVEDAPSQNSSIACCEQICPDTAMLEDLYNAAVARGAAPSTDFEDTDCGGEAMHHFDNVVDCCEVSEPDEIQDVIDKCTPTPSPVALPGGSDPPVACASWVHQSGTARKSTAESFSAAHYSSYSRPPLDARRGNIVEPLSIPLDVRPQVGHVRGPSLPELPLAEDGRQLGLPEAVRKSKFRGRSVSGQMLFRQRFPDARRGGAERVRLIRAGAESVTTRPT